MIVLVLSGLFLGAVYSRIAAKIAHDTITGEHSTVIRCLLTDFPVHTSRLIVYILGPAVTTLLFYEFYRLDGFSTSLLAGVTLGSLLILAALIDMESRIIPNWLVIFVLASGFIFRVAGVLPGGISEGLAGLLPGLFLLGMVYILSGGKIGEGDIKFSSVLGIYVGWKGALVALTITSVVGLVAALILLALRVIKAKDAFPYAPFISVGFLFAFLIVR